MIADGRFVRKTNKSKKMKSTLPLLYLKETGTQILSLLCMKGMKGIFENKLPQKEGNKADKNLVP